jgi:hypothetical protein
MNNKTFSYLHENKKGKDKSKSKNANPDYDSEIEGYNCLIKQTWNDIKTK